jgi:hypothetical protein
VAPSAVPYSLSLGHAHLLVVEERQLAQSLPVAHDLAAYLITTHAQELVRSLRGSISLDDTRFEVAPCGVCRPRSHWHGEHPDSVESSMILFPRTCLSGAAHPDL